MLLSIRIPLACSHWLYGILVLSGGTVATAVYLWSTALTGVLPAAGLAVVCMAAMACHGRYTLRRMPHVLELDRERGNAILHFDSGKPAAKAFPVRLTHALHWPGLLQYLEFADENQQHYPVLILTDMLPAESFRLLAAWAQRMQHRNHHFA